MLRSSERLLVGGDGAHAARLAADDLVEGLTGGGPFAVALAGGSTPAMLYRTLAAAPYRDHLAAHDIEWFWGDERAVPPDHPDSNYRMAVETLLAPLEVPPERIHRMPAGAPDLDTAAADYEQALRRIVAAGPDEIPILDCILLGVGLDGHTASLFPGSAALSENQRLVVANYAPGLNSWRMTMTYPLLLSARRVIFLVTGADKAPIMGRLLAEPPADLPAARLRDARGRVDWVLDTAAARLVSRPPAE